MIISTFAGPGMSSGLQPDMGDRTGEKDPLTSSSDEDDQGDNKRRLERRRRRESTISAAEEAKLLADEDENREPDPVEACAKQMQQLQPPTARMEDDPLEGTSARFLQQPAVPPLHPAYSGTARDNVVRKINDHVVPCPITATRNGAADSVNKSNTANPSGADVPTANPSGAGGERENIFSYGAYSVVNGLRRNQKTNRSLRGGAEVDPGLIGSFNVEGDDRILLSNNRFLVEKKTEYHIQF